MPQKIEHIDAIARRLQREVVFVVFHKPLKEIPGQPTRFFDSTSKYDWENCQVRVKLIAWLNANRIMWNPCGDFANPNTMASYRGQIYVDLPCTLELPAYQALITYMEMPNGQMRYSNATLYKLELESAMENAEHDQPGFWDRWAENF